MRGIPRVVDYFDSPIILDTDVTTIPKFGDPPLQVVASLYDAVFEIYIAYDDIGKPLGLYRYNTHLSTWELFCVIGGSSNPVLSQLLPVGSRIGITSMLGSDLTAGNGSILVQFIGRFT
jgi:hypothetical protein